MTYLDPFPQGTRISQEFRSSPGGYNPPGGHTGRDYAVPVGTPIRAAADGIIRHSSWFTDNYQANDWWLTRYGGDTLVLDCTDANGRSFTMPTFVYAHCSDTAAEVGQFVRKGEIIGYSGNSGTATSGPHCHVERMNPGFDLSNDVYGRSPVGFDEFYTGSGIAAQGNITTEEEDMPLTKQDVDNIAARVAEVIQPMHDVTRQYIPGAVLDVPVVYRDPTTGEPTEQTTTLRTVTGFTDFQHVATRQAIARGIVDSIRASSGPDAAAIAEAAFAEFLGKLAKVNLTIKAGE